MVVVGRVKDVEVVMINIVTAQDIGSEFQQQGLSNNVVWCFCLVISCLYDPLHGGVYIARKYSQYIMHKRRRHNVLNGEIAEV